MFGEFDSDGVRPPSPWDSLASPTHHGVPKLVPEVEEGNVEYKLQLLSPTRARFARLVTQLNWRLLEGGGRAYYELGVADSGVLVGLPRKQLEESLETLEMMATEIGASVIVVKEIEVSAELSSIAESQLERWDGKKSARRRDLLRMMNSDTSPVTSSTELEAEFSSTDITDTEETASSPITPPASLDDSTIRPLATPFPFDPALAMFTVDVEENIISYADGEAPVGQASTDLATEFSISLVISCVYKPRPPRKRVTVIPPSTHLEYAKKKRKNGYLPSKSNNVTSNGDLVVQESLDTLSQPKETKFRRDKRDKRQELKHDASLTHAPTGRPAKSPVDSTAPVVPLCSTDKPIASVLESLTTDAGPPDGDTLPTTDTSKESRLIVEVLIVKKLSMNEPFLDLEGFSLQ